MRHRFGKVLTTTTGGREFTKGIRFQCFAVVDHDRLEDMFFCIHIPTGFAITSGSFIRCYHCAKVLQKDVPRELRTTTNAEVVRVGMRDYVWRWNFSFNQQLDFMPEFQEG